VTLTCDQMFPIPVLTTSCCPLGTNTVNRSAVFGVHYLRDTEGACALEVPTADAPGYSRLLNENMRGRTRAFSGRPTMPCFADSTACE